MSTSLSWKKIGIAFVSIYVVFMILVGATILLAPIFTFCGVLIFAACQSGNPLILFVTTWITPAILALLTSPFMVDYYEKSQELKQLKESLGDEADADR